MYNNNHNSKLHPIILFSSHINFSTTNCIQNIFINLRAIEVCVKLTKVVYMHSKI